MSNLSLSRREMLGGTAAAAALAMAQSPLTANQKAEGSGAKFHLKKAVRIGMVGGELKNLSLAEKFAAVKAVGFDGIELNSPSNLKAKEVLAAVDSSGLQVHSICDSVHWNQPLSDPDPAVRKKGLEALQTALRDAKAFGATGVLLVPAVVNKDVYYADAYKRSQAEIRKAVPLAEELGVDILNENVWNNFLLSPLEMARYIDEFDSSHVGSYFDIGNILRYGWPQHWIAALGSRIGKLHIKDFSREKMNKEGLWKGFSGEIGDGSIDWPQVRAQLKKIGYTNGWATAEVGGGGKKRLAEVLKRMKNALDE